MVKKSLTLKTKKFFEEPANERLDEIQNLSKQINFNDYLSFQRWKLHEKFYQF